MSDAKRRKDSNRAALSKCWMEDIEWELIPNTLREVSLGNNLVGRTVSVYRAFLIIYFVSVRIFMVGSLDNSSGKMESRCFFFAHRTVMVMWNHTKGSKWRSISVIS